MSKQLLCKELKLEVGMHEVDRGNNSMFILWSPLTHSYLVVLVLGWCRLHGKPLMIRQLKSCSALSLARALPFPNIQPCLNHLCYWITKRWLAESRSRVSKSVETLRMPNLLHANMQTCKCASVRVVDDGDVVNPNQINQSVNSHD